ncbi:HAD superfamily hydrolase (TIGR01459 family) [Bradyrhizobium sp. USDA 4524]|uniref:TIGR01459 family HAD-type hydrolase n=1 Tax=unclassified Bradyrhizobium TaxID=2631580 RepID=UPI00209F4F95|nr:MULTISPECIES: TIGR01459 family HAD-type hydrolase [unclassified Bradyrhizobium]MCP1842414.1 HAD superfamily hydrolase (TIGR01459 family) [Bradyrhizobium sp. USDA 4538]MCP1902978.1 HAD superfamily hydrolase (TIGR01459 family) [Bradyrhizobium sp. USDA 4537]MCP1991365.1 HAD superfamily hydrolase (TIGR01459 family) [Bradyrhizobium sp. USDA 4539]
MKADATAIAGLHAIADRFDHVLLDQWGTLHEGLAVFPAALDCVARLREAGKRILVLSNSGKRAGSNQRRLATLGLPPDAYDGVLSSGEVTWRGLHAREQAPFAELGRACFLISRDGDRSIVDGTDLVVVSNMREADFILLGGLDDDAAEPERWREPLATAAARQLPMLCANPDLVMFGVAGLIPAPGALAAFYHSLGGTVLFVGKPHPPMFAAALDQLGRPPPDRILVIGDSLDHDIAGGRTAGMLTLLIGSGAHRATLAQASDLPRAIQTVAGTAARMPHWTMDHLTW